MADSRLSGAYSYRCNWQPILALNLEGGLVCFSDTIAAVQATQKTTAARCREQAPNTPTGTNHYGYGMGSMYTSNLAVKLELKSETSECHPKSLSLLHNPQPFPPGPTERREPACGLSTAYGNASQHSSAHRVTSIRHRQYC